MCQLARIVGWIYHNQWMKVMQGGLENLRRYAAAQLPSAAAKRSKFSSKLYTPPSPASFKLAVLQDFLYTCNWILCIPIQRAVCNPFKGQFTRFSVHISTWMRIAALLAIDKAGLQCQITKKKLRKHWRNSSEPEKTNDALGRLHLAQPPDET